MRPEPVQSQLKCSIAGITVRFTPGCLRNGLLDSFVHGPLEQG